VSHHRTAAETAVRPLIDYPVLIEPTIFWSVPRAAARARPGSLPLEDLASLYHRRVGPDGERIACYYDGSGRNELCLRDPETGELTHITHVEDIEAALLMLHGVDDPRCPVSQALRDALEAHRGWTEGSEFEYEELGEEGHGSTDTDHRTRVYRLLAELLDDRLSAE
jgi:hypothetical protein